MKAKVISLEKARTNREASKKRPRKKRIQMTRVLISGLTERDFFLEVSTRHDMPPHRCHICRRQQGDKGVFFSEDGEPCIVGMQLARHSVKVSGDLEFNFLICHECAILLGAYRNSLEEE